jgi:hypothetical protein
MDEIRYQEIENNETRKSQVRVASASSKKTKVAPKKKNEKAFLDLSTSVGYR